MSVNQLLEFLDANNITYWTSTDEDIGIVIQDLRLFVVAWKDRDYVVYNRFRESDRTKISIEEFIDFLKVEAT